MKNAYRLSFLIFWLVILIQTVVITHFWPKIHQPIDVNLLEALNETIDLQERSLKLHNQETLKAFEKECNKAKRGMEFLAKAQSMNKLAITYLHILDSLQRQANCDVQILAKEIDEQKQLFHTAISAEILSDFHKEDVKVLNANLNPYKDAKLLSSFKVSDTLLKWLIEQEKTNVLTRNKLFIEILFGKISYRSIIYAKYRVAMIPSAMKIEKDDWFSTKVYLAQNATKTKPLIAVDGKRLKLDKNGTAIYKCATDELGKYSINGKITSKPSAAGLVKTIPFTIDYEVLEKCN